MHCMTSAEPFAAARPGLGADVPERPALEGLEAKWSQRWRDQGTYDFVRPDSRAEVFSIDTPPPTVSGSLHVGHVFSYTHTDLVARYQRMRGKRVFYPMGWDDNGLPTERRVQNYYGVRCDATLAYDPAFEPPARPDPKRPISISRANFIELCLRLTATDERAFEDLWRQLGLSVDWRTLYSTISPEAATVAQRAFLRNLARGEAYLSHAPTLWDVSFGTAVAQAELVDRDYPGFYHRIGFHRPDGSLLHVETTRPELVVSVCALIAHPSDERYQPLFGSTVRSPVFGVEVPVLAHHKAEPDKGAGIAMCCTFGDLTDVQWWRELNLPTRTVVTRDGRLQAETPDWLADPAPYAELAGKTTYSARQAMVELLRQSGDLDGEPTPTMRKANFYEKGDKPLEIVASRQWYIANGGRDQALKAALLARGEELAWVPEYMKHRYDDWVAGVSGDWLVSRQRFFGVPFPIWYALDDQGEPDFDHPIRPDESALPVDPMRDPAPGFDPAQRDQPGGFTADQDVMDTWATSSLTPQIACGWERDQELFDLTFPMDLAPQAHDIIRTWLFSRVVRSHLEHGCAPWARAALSGFVVDPDRKKMSKSLGNVVVPSDTLDRFGSDAVRWRAAMARPGTDSPFDERQMKVGRRLATKILNASKFILGFPGLDPAGWSLEQVAEPVDQAMLASLKTVVEQATAAFEAFEYTDALETAERFFWTFCDDYVELVKDRAYGGRGPAAAQSAQAALGLALGVLLRLFAPICPFVTEEAWSWFQTGSIHLASWPQPDEVDPGSVTAEVLEQASAALIAIRGAKSQAKASMKAEVADIVFRGPAASLEALRLVQADLKAVAHLVGDFSWVEAEGGLDASVELAPVEAAPPARTD
ncbi:MAG: valine--tRNA ligase [Propionibacteriaceae bacterium]|jgi:valyl-tRNA synthetase|nr:valine--tRNA ligase [Propionibacteriaceae bacterium]